jgi:protein-S-isoprenylcysteine O-methyltransferase Ste14
MPVRYTINTFKGLTFAWVICLMIIFQNFSRGMYVYLFLHGTYGIAWLYKDIMFGDATFKQKGTFGSNLIFAIFLLVYWMIPLPLAMGAGISNPSLLRIILVVSLYIFGLILMLGSDYQKTTTLAERKGLISTGFFKLTRNPNYLGESMIYGSFAICSGHIISYLIFILGSGTLFTINIYLKDKLSY